MERSEKEHAPGDAVVNHLVRKVARHLKTCAHIHPVHRLPHLEAHMVPVVGLEALGRGTVNQHVQGSNRGACLLNCHPACTWHRKVNQCAIGMHPLALKVLERGSQARRVDIHKEDRSALRSDFTRKCKADAMSSAGDERRLPTKKVRRNDLHAQTLLFKLGAPNPRRGGTR